MKPENNYRVSIKWRFNTERSIEVFRNVKSLEAAKAIIDRRDKFYMKSATYNNKIDLLK